MIAILTIISILVMSLLMRFIPSLMPPISSFISLLYLMLLVLLISLLYLMLLNSRLSYFFYWFFQFCWFWYVIAWVIDHGLLFQCFLFFTDLNDFSNFGAVGEIYNIYIYIYIYTFLLMLVNYRKRYYLCLSFPLIFLIMSIISILFIILVLLILSPMSLISMVFILSLLFMIPCISIIWMLSPFCYFNIVLFRFLILSVCYNMSEICVAST